MTSAEMYVRVCTRMYEYVSYEYEYEYEYEYAH